MSFSVLAVRTGEEDETDLYPDPGETPDSVEPESTDGSTAVYRVSAIRVVSLATKPPKATASFKDIGANLIITDSRVAVACSKFDKGGGWHAWSVGGLVVSAGANAVSKARAARRRRGKMLVGHVRYEWLGQIETTERHGMSGRNGLQLLMADPTPDGAAALILDVTLDKRQAPGPIAKEIARRAATYMSAHDEQEIERPAWTTYAANPTAERIDKTTERYRLPRMSR